jgi:GT2 family glycosyltransferase
VSTVSVVIVTHEHAGAIAATIGALLRELTADDELIVVDNASSDGTADVVAGAAPIARLLRQGENIGFPAAANAGAALAEGDLIVLLNPDTVVAPGWGAAIRRPLEDRRGWSAWQGLVTTSGGERVNSAEGVVHFTGISWAGGDGQPVAAAPSQPREVAFASGACLAIPAAVWAECGGLDGDFFLYHEDVDLSLRLRLAGGVVGVEPAARADHDYAFAKGALKWRLLERNRWATIVRTYPGALLAVTLPALLATELALVVVAATGGWLGQKLLAWGDVLRSLPRLLRERREIQARRTISARAFSGHMTADLDSQHLGRAARSPGLNRALRLYWRAARALLR